jgi:hypothetical protein
MSAQDQALYLLSAVGAGMMVVALFLVRQLRKHEREQAALDHSKALPAE